MLLLTLRGTPTLYYGDEIGIGHVDIPADRVQDPWAKREPDLGVGRDPSRTPMQWDAGQFAGFSTREPWLPLTPDRETRNVATMRDDNSSILALTRKLLHYRRERAALNKGEWRLLCSSDDILAYERVSGEERAFVTLNFCSESRSCALPTTAGATITISTHGDRRGEAVGTVLCLRGDEGVLLNSP
jgi:alpha-glucosidase